jgi:hypothetical protein
MTHRYVPLNWIQWLTLVLCAAVALGFAWGFHEIKDVQAHQNDALRSIICRAERRRSHGAGAVGCGAPARGAVLREVA